jgi:tetratricopeptide (TPR) repeat protein
MLEQMTAGGSKDPFAWYALANEYKNLDRADDAVSTYAALRAIDPSYVPQYLMCGSLLSKLGRKADAVEWLRAGIEAARKKGDNHAIGELETALAEAEDD